MARLFPRDGAVGRAVDLRLLRRLWPFVRPQRGLILASLALLLTTSAAALAMTWVVMLIIERHVEGDSSEGLGVLLAWFAALALFEMLGRALGTWTVDVAGQNALLGLRSTLFRHLQALSSAFHDRTPTGRVVGRVTTDIEALQEMFSSGVVTVLGDVIFLCATVALLFTLHWQLTLAVLVVVPLLIGLTLWMRVRVRAAYADMIDSRSRLNAFLHEHIVGMAVVQMFTRERRVRSAFGGISGDMRDAQLRSVSWESVLSASTELLSHLTVALILAYGGSLLLGESLATGLTLAALFAFIDYMRKFFVPLNDLSLKVTVMQSAMTAAERIFHLLDHDDFIPAPKSVVPLPAARGAIAFRGVTFGYDPAEPVLRDVSFEVAPGERVAIVGATGGGKTTLLKLLTRLYDVGEGSITLDGVDVRDYALSELRSRIGIVPQDVFLFGGDVLHNVRLGHPEISEAEARAAADRLHLDQVVARFPLGYHEPVRERGANLSSGERQLIAFARVLAVAPAVLALDEATSQVDTRTEHLLQDALHDLTRERTSLIIAHRLSTIRDVDRILVIANGRLIEQGTHEELLRAGGAYRRLNELQFVSDR
ncbi:MAG: ABC transporter ATP-binding protein [Planctomycetota bacterium]|jgi:ATP-binding cassette subfamily B protein|nr:ABC transporter ATP-binding protein [Planctomycetota bacterium]